ncbi:MAG: undecaprenyl/decaprenyl-phosphate alpha-N-acetylglucosaminyl 1-phosphate transferase [Clostridium sp.]|nr:undecaprenyl/decaprenyl-phosphate alpha-N-acetylglucosaminyl 1-phosphate transferase [Clostridium sp.]
MSIDIWLYIDLFAFLMVVLLTGVLIPQILLIAFRKNLLDLPDERKIHKVAVPRLGGLAFFPSILFTMSLAFGVFRQAYPNVLLSIPNYNITSLCFLICAAVILYVVGIADDLIGLRYRAKFAAQIFGSLLLILGGIQITNLHGFIGITELQPWASFLLTVLLTVFITNSINLIDGIDGLASGLSAIAFGFYGTVFYFTGHHIYAMICFCTLGALVPFFYYNVFGNATKHGKIFMGDTGALTIGLLLSVMSICICNIQDSQLPINPAVAAFTPLMIPCCDVVRVYIKRIKERRNPFMPDKTHIHHKLLALGMTQRVAMPLIVISSFILTLINYALGYIINITLLFCIDLLIWCIANMALSRAIKQKKNNFS